MDMTEQKERPIVVIIDDIIINIKIIGACLGDEFLIYSATNGAAGLQLIHEKRPDVILLDVVMPGMDGYEICRRLKSDPDTKDIPIIFVTAQNEVDEEARGLTMGAVDYITKPVVPAIVRARVRNQAELKRLRDRLAHLSATDGLTGLANRRHFDQTLEREWARGLRSQHPLSVIMLDIDFFKAFNDGYGHLAGDDCLKRVAVALASATLRNGSDLVARYGGEEFVALLADTTLEGALIVAERMKSSIDTLALPHHYSKIAATVTVSLGVATTIPTTEQNSMTLLLSADRMLYRAKANGRNRIMADA